MLKLKSSYALIFACADKDLHGHVGHSLLSGFAKQCWFESGPSLALGAAGSSLELGLPK